MLTNLFRRRYLISLAYLLVVLIGFLAWRSIPLELAPDLSLPRITISYSWGSASPEVMEQEVTRRVEQAANRLRDVENIESVTSEGQSSVTVTFNSQAPVDFRIVELQEYLSGLEDELPESVNRRGVSRRVPQELQEMENFITWSLSGDRAVSDLLEYARRTIRIPLLGIDGLADIDIQGARDPALTIEFNTEALEELQLNPRSIMTDIRNNLEWRSSGYTQRAGMRYSILIPPQFGGIEDIRSMRLQLPGSQRRIRLSEVASVAVLDYPATSLYRINGTPALSLSFIKESGADAIGLAEEIEQRMEAIQAALPGDITLRLAYDGTEQLREQFAELQYQAVISIVVVFGVLLIFIRRFRAPFVILGSIGFSVLMSLGVLYFIGYTLNMITLAGITVAIGMIIDNAVVVFEQVNPRLPAAREERLQHIRNELPRALVPVIGSTLTTVGIFIPLFFAMEELRIFLVPLAVALTLTMLSSVLIALSWIPYALIWLVPSDKVHSLADSPSDNPGKTAADNGESSLFHGWLRRPFLVLFAWRHKLRWVPYIALFAVLGIPLFAIETPDWEEEETVWPEFTRVYFDNRNDIDPLIGGLTYRFFNDTFFGSPWGFPEQQRININITVPQGTPIDEIDKMARNFEEIAGPYREAFTFFDTRVSEYSGATLTFYIDNDYLVRPEPYIYYAEAMYLAARTGNSSIRVSGLGEGLYSGSIGGGISGRRITLRGYNYQQLLDLARDLERRLRQNRRVQAVDIHGTGSFGGRGNLYQYVLDLSEEELAKRGLNRGELYQALALDLNPTNTVGRVEMDGRRLFLIGRNSDRTTYDEEVFQEKRLSAEGQVFSLEQVASLGREQSQSTIQREDQQYRRVVTVDFLGPFQLADTFVQSVVDATPVPVGSSIEYGSGFFSSGTDDSVRNLMVVLGMSLLAVWMIVSALLESWIDPLVVILAVPLSLIGIMAGSLWHDLAFDRGAIAGTLLCVGVVVNNSILLMHEKERFRSLGIHGFRSWLYVYRNKMRAVLITTLTTIGGLIPMIVFGENEFWQQLATVTCWGLAGSTLFLLLLMGIWEGSRRSEKANVNRGTRIKQIRRVVTDFFHSRKSEESEPSVT